MSISNYYNMTATLTVKTKTGQNEYGEPVFTEAVSTFSCTVQPNTGRSGEGLSIEERGKVTVSTHRLYCAISVALTEGDTVTVGNRDYDVILVSDDAGRDHHSLVFLRLVR